LNLPLGVEGYWNVVAETAQHGSPHGSDYRLGMNRCSVPLKVAPMKVASMEGMRGAGSLGSLVLEVMAEDLTRMAAPGHLAWGPGVMAAVTRGLVRMSDRSGHFHPRVGMGSCQPATILGRLTSAADDGLLSPGAPQILKQ
jgi:hypothetical protein